MVVTSMAFTSSQFVLPPTYRVACTPPGTRHVCLLLGQGKREDTGSVGAAHEAGEESLDPRAPSDGDDYVLPSVHAVRRRARVVAASALELPQMLPSLRIERVEYALRRAGEHEVARRGEDGGTHRGIVVPPPHFLAVGVEGGDPARYVGRVYDDCGSPVRDAFLELPATARDRRAGVLNRAVEELCLRVEAGVRPFLAARRSREEVDFLALFLGIDARGHLAVGVDLTPVDAVDEGRHAYQITVRTVEDEEVPVLVEVAEQLAPVLLEE